MSEEKKTEETNPVVAAVDKIVEATATYLRAIFPSLYKMAEDKEKSK